MPLFEIEHCISLSKVERDQIAQAITQIHTRKFCTPSLFVNIRFTNVANHILYVAGEEVSRICPNTALWRILSLQSTPMLTRIIKRSINRILAFVRGGGPRTTGHLGELAEQILEAWNRIVNAGKKGHGDRELKVVTIVGSISAGLESGFVLPPVSILLDDPLRTPLSF